MQMRGRLLDGDQTLFRDDNFADLFSQVGQPAVAPARLALVLVLQFMEALTDRQAADAVRTRIDWKYLLGLPLTDSGFHHTVLSEFRTRLLDHGAERRLFEAVLEAALVRDLVQARGRQRTDSTHVLAAVHSMTRIEAVTETLRHALNEARRCLRPHWPADEAVEPTRVEVVDDQPRPGERDRKRAGDLVEALSLRREADDGGAVSCERVVGARGVAECGVLGIGEGAGTNRNGFTSMAAV